MWGAWCLRFGTLGDHFGTLGVSWETMRDCGLHFDSLLGTEAKSPCFVRARFQVTFLTNFKVEMRMSGAPKTRFVY